MIEQKELHIMTRTIAKPPIEGSESPAKREDIIKKMHVIFDMDPDQRTKDLIAAMIISEMSQADHLDKAQRIKRLKSCLIKLLPLLFRTPADGAVDEPPRPRLPSDKEELTTMSKLLAQHVDENFIQPYLDRLTEGDEKQTKA